MFKKIKFILALVLMCGLGTCHHIHNEQCGYDPKTGEGCTHQCNETDLPSGDLRPDE